MGEDTFSTACLHCFDEHPREPKGNSFWEPFPLHCDFETISEIDVNDLASGSLKHDVAWVAISKSKNVPNHGHSGEGAGVIGSALEPDF
jgi:hypothetical protein